MLRSDFPNGANREFKNFAGSYVAVPMLKLTMRPIISNLLLLLLPTDVPIIVYIYFSF